MMAAARRAGLRLRALAGDPQMRGGHILLLNAAITGVLGLVFWAISSRVVSSDALGSGAAWVGAVMTVSSVCQLNSYLLLPNYLGRAGRRGRRLLLITYAVTVPVSALGGWLYFLLLAPEEVVAVGGPRTGGLVFAAACALWTVFTLQDAALAGTRRYGLIPWENGLYGLAKLGLLVGLAGTGIWALPLATVIPLLVLIPAITVVLIRRLSPARLPEPEPGAFAGMARMASIDWVGTSAAAVSTAYLPVLVVQILGAAQGAAFAVVWALVQAVDMAVGAVSLSATVEIVAAREHTARIVRGLLVRVLLFSGAAAVGAALLARPLLTLYAPTYVDPGAELLVILTLASVPRAVTSLALAVARAQRLPGHILVLQVGMTVLVVAGTLVLVPGTGVIGAGVVWLGAQLVVGVAAAFALPRLLRARPAGPAADGATRVGDTSTTRSTADATGGTS
ncbi:MAG: hypothetical protein KJ548_08290 [Actinobacteria bacterium]|nr:hypothetical protein [Actinomycetota bacterium]MCG2798886.1 hypothetical protein [Cellulomonas sp.]